jgi:hypothetical protein
MLRNIGRIATNVCRQHRIAFEAVRALGIDKKSLVFISKFNHFLFCYSASTPLQMPSLSPTMSEGTIIRWLKKEGLTIN